MEATEYAWKACSLRVGPRLVSGGTEVEGLCGVEEDVGSDVIGLCGVEVGRSAAVYGGSIDTEATLG